MSGPRIPVSTYRLQFNQHLRFNDAKDLVAYLHELGITDLYASPCCKRSAEACTAMMSRTRLTSIRNWVAMKNSMASSGSCSGMTWVYCSTSCQIIWRPRARIHGGWTCWKMVLDRRSRRTLMSIGTRRAALWRIAYCCQFLEGPTRRRLRAANCGSPMDEADSS
jgi:hypothetical protein